MILLTGVAGFIGSRLCRHLLEEGFPVVGVDSFPDYYPTWIKEKNIENLREAGRLEFIHEDLNKLDLASLMKRVDYVFHLAAQAGVRASWGQNFSVYTQNNIEVTQKLLETAKESRIKKFIYASSSSVYGHCPELPMSEKSPLYPFSPYGVTKLAAEQLCLLYHKNYGVPCLSLRLFTVYGPGQRPDMAFHKFFKAIRDDQKIQVFGDGKQTRDFTYVDDVVQAFIDAMKKGKIGETYNIGGGSRRKLEDVFPLLEEICQKKIKIQWADKQKGDIQDTFAKIDKAREDLGYSPLIELYQGLRKEWIWLQKLYSS